MVIYSIRPGFAVTKEVLQIVLGWVIETGYNAVEPILECLMGCQKQKTPHRLSVPCRNLDLDTTWRTVNHIEVELLIWISRVPWHRGQYERWECVEGRTQQADRRRQLYGAVALPGYTKLKSEGGPCANLITVVLGSI